MPGRDDARQRVTRLFRRSSVNDLAALKRAVHTRSRTTVFRVLSELGYLTSCSHTGRFYTLEGIPDFDEDGLWTQEGALFSKYRTLRETIVRLVEVAPAGRTQAELRERLRLRVHDTLRDLTRARRIDRAEVERLYVYVSIQKATARRQLEKRRQFVEEKVAPEPDLPTAAVVEVLLEVIHGAGAWTAPGTVAKRLGARGFSVSPEQVEKVFRDHGIEKKGARSRSP